MNESRRLKRWATGSVAAVLCLLIVAFAFLIRSLATPKVLVPADLLEHQIPIAQSRPDKPPSNPAISDVVEQFYPYQEFLRREIHRGNLPLWNPYVLNGTPFLATTVSMVFSPIHWLLFFLPHPLFYEWSAFLKLWIAGSGIYFFCRKIGLDHWSAVISGTVFMFCGYNIYFLLFPNSSVSCLLGWALFAAESFLTGGKTKRFALLSFIILLSILSGHVESAALLGIAVAIYATVRDWRRSLFVYIAIALAVLGSAVVTLPFIEFLLHSSTYVLRSYPGGNFFFLPPSVWPAFLIPYFLGTPINNISEPWYFEGAIYIGILPFFLGSLSLGCRDRMEYKLPSLVLLVWGLSILFGVFPVFDLFTSLPGLRQANHFHIVQICHAAIAVLSGEGVACVSSRRVGMRSMVIAVIGALVVGIVAGFCYADPNWNPDAANGRFFFLDREWPWPLYPVWSIVTLLAIVAFSAHDAFAIVCWAVIALNGFVYGFFFNPVVSPASNLNAPVPSVIAQMQRFPHERMVGIGVGTAPPNYPMVWNLRDVRGYESLVMQRLPRVYRFLTSSNGDSHHFVPGVNRSVLNLLKRLGCSLILTPAPLEAPDLEQLRGQFPYLYRIRGVQRVHWADSVVPVGDSETALEHVLRNPQWRVVAIEGLTDEKNWLNSSHANEPGTINWLVDDPDCVLLEVETRSPSWLVLRDSYFMGWEAEIDGKPARIYRADYLFRAVLVPPGIHRVGFFYRPLVFRIGLVISSASILLILVLAANRWVVCWGGPFRRRVNSTGGEYPSG